MFTLAPPTGADTAYVSIVFAGQITLAERREAFGLAADAALATPAGS